MEALATTTVLKLDDDLLNFSLDGENDEERKTSSSSSSESSERSSDEPEFAEEELEWVLNKDAFPAVETCLDILSDGLGVVLDHHSPVSVLDNVENGKGSALMSCCGYLKIPVSHPVRARSKGSRRRRQTGFADTGIMQCEWSNQVVKYKKSLLPSLPAKRSGDDSMGRRCQHCLVEKTPQWRAGPAGPKTLCNACGVRYKSGRLFPEYRPANSPTFLSTLHSNSHRKVLEMRKQKVVGTEEMMLNASRDYRVV